MLVVSRRADQVIRIGDDIKIMVVDVRGDLVQIGIDAPRDVPVHREEIYKQIIEQEGTNRTVGKRRASR